MDFSCWCHGRPGVVPLFLQGDSFSWRVIHFSCRVGDCLWISYINHQSFILLSLYPSIKLGHTSVIIVIIIVTLSVCMCKSVVFSVRWLNEGMDESLSCCVLYLWMSLSGCSVDCVWWICLCLWRCVCVCVCVCVWKIVGMCAHL